MKYYAYLCTEITSIMRTLVSWLIISIMWSAVLLLMLLTGVGIQVVTIACLCLMAFLIGMLIAKIEKYLKE